MRRRRSRGDDKTKKITIKKLPKRNSFVVRYPDGHRVETPSVEIQGVSKLYIDDTTQEHVISTEANINVGYNGTCPICGAFNEDRHVHA